MAVPLGVVNALMNFLVWTVHAIVTRLSESVYARASAWEVSKHGRTACTDMSEISPTSLLLCNGASRSRRARTWWVIFLLISLSLLIPLELLVESGIGKNKRCRPYTIRESKGVCASHWNGHSMAGIAASALLVQRFEWVDREWEVVLEGSAKSPRATEVRTRNALRESRRVLAADCTVSLAVCKNCASLLISRSTSAFHTVVSKMKTADMEERKGSGDVTYDKAMMLAFFFWKGDSVPYEGRRATGGRRISVYGVETLMTEKQTKLVLSGSNADWWMNVTGMHEGKVNARMYNVSCVTDGFTASNFTNAISLFRTAQMEQPGVRHLNVDGDISNLQPLTASDAAKSVFAMKAEDWSADCAGDVDVYSECGSFSPLFVAPFFALAALLFVIWIAVRVGLHGVRAIVPYDAQSWRRKAHELARAGTNTHLTGGGGGIGASDDSIGARGLWTEERDPNADAVYDPNVFVMQSAVPATGRNAYGNFRDVGFMELGAVPTTRFYGPSPRFDADR